MKRRIDYAPQYWLSGFTAEYEKRIEQKLEYIQFGNHKLRQTEYSILYYELVSLALINYAAGSTFRKIRNYFYNAAKISLQVMRLRGTEASGRIDIAVPEDSLQPFDIGKAIEEGFYKSSGGRDFSLGNSRVGLEGMYLALLLNDLELATNIADLVWDPLDADYIGPDSEVCTPNQQHMAYGLRDFLHGKEKNANEALDIVNTSPPDTFYQAQILKALIQSNSTKFLQQLDSLLSWHEKEAKKEENEKVPKYLMSIEGLGLSSLACINDVVNIDDLPQDNVYLPLTLLQTY